MDIIVRSGLKDSRKLLKNVPAIDIAKILPEIESHRAAKLLASLPLEKQIGIAIISKDWQFAKMVKFVPVKKTILLLHIE